ncbi:MAG: EAL domain-containing protein [Eubacterium sp.]|nr:EAL domain-containing protein [Eubacterium sp.]
MKIKRNKITHKNKLRRNLLSVRIALITIISSIASIIAIEFGYILTQSIIRDYDEILDVDYEDSELMNDVMSKINKHEAIIFHHMVEQDPHERRKILNEEEDMEIRLQETMSSFEQNVRGTQYESGYHDLFSQVTNYLKNVQMVIDLSRDGNEQTANYYMRSVLAPIVRDMDELISEMENTLRRDVEDTKVKIRDNVGMMRIFVRIVLFILIVAAVFNVIYCVKISDEMVSCDMLTGVANFDNLIRVGEKLGKKRRLELYSGLAISIKDFKFINQEYGSSIGDRVLKEYATALNDKLKRNEIVARNGGDNFVALLEKDHVDDFLKSIMKVPVSLGEKMGLTLTSRCGIYQITESDTIYDVINAGVIAVGETRQSGANDFIWFRRERRDEMVRQKDILNGYHKAIDEEEFVVYYQPKVNLKTRTLCGCEALVRWIRNGELVPPNSFIPVLENDGKVQELDFYVFDRVCRDIGDWQRRGIQPVRVSSNFSKLHLHNKNFVDDVLSVVERYGADPYYLETELTESSGYEDLDAMKFFVSEMREAGIHTSMDDFGTGYSSLSLLRDIDMDVIKLDRTFLRDENDAKEEKMVENIVKMIHDLDRHVICEGVETEEQVEFLKRVGCTMAQGFLFDRPLTKEEFEKRLINPYYSS